VKLSGWLWGSPGTPSVDTGDFSWQEGGHLVFLTVRLHRTRKLEIRGAIPLLHLCRYGVDRDAFTFLTTYDVTALFNVERDVTVIVEGN
jgi:hypothetical protein